MFKNYLIVAVRNIVKHKGYSIINVAGLAIGLAIFSLTAALFKFQLSFNQFHKDADRIYSIVKVLPSGAAEDRHSARTRAPLRRLLLNEFSEIEDATRWIPTDRLVMRHKENKFYAEEGTILLVDSNFLTFFSFEMHTGDPDTALLESNSVVLTESTARKYFGNANAMGRKLIIGKDLEVVVTGVTKDVPLNSSLKYDVLVSLNTFDWETNWNIKGATFEIGIRKAHGATMTNIMRLILTDFLKLIGFAMIITWPLFYFVDKILVPDIFAYSAETGFAFYIYAGALALITGFAAVLFQTIKAGRANPIDALRYE